MTTETIAEINPGRNEPEEEICHLKPVFHLCESVANMTSVRVSYSPPG